MARFGVLRIALLAVITLLLQGTWVLAGTTGRIEGKVLDQNGNVIAGVKVTAASPGQSASSTTASNGFYVILNLSPDTYSVTATKDGYDTSTIFGVTVTADQGSMADIRMHTSAKTIGHITTKAAASVVSRTVTGDLYAVNAQQIARSNGSAGGAETLYSQNSVAGSLPGVVRLVGSGPGYFGQGTLSLRGGSYDQVGYELEGIPLNRGFDAFNSTTFNTNGLANLQVYTGGAPASEGGAMAGFINEGIGRGKYPGGADITAAMGSPLYNHTLQADVYGGTPDARFTYYVSTLATNQYVNFGDRSNLANTSIAIPANDAGCAAFNYNMTHVFGGPAIDCSASQVLNMPVSQGAYPSVPFAANRDTATNLHWSVPHNGLNDDLQALYVVGTGEEAPQGMYGLSSADYFQSSTIQGPPGPGNTILWPTGSWYRGYVGQPYDPALGLTLTWPSSGNSVSGQIPSNFQDSQRQQYSITKLGYTRSLTQNSYVRIYGYQVYSFWNIDQPINFFAGGTFYQLHNHLTGTALDYENQINSQNLIKFHGEYSRDQTLRYNYANYPALENGALTCNPSPCTPGSTVTQVPAPFSYWNTVAPLDWTGVVSDTFKPGDKILLDLGLRYDITGYQLMPMVVNGPNGLAAQGEKLYGQCLFGFAYSPSDPANIGNGSQNCFDILTAGVKSGALLAKDGPGQFAWQNAAGYLGFQDWSPRFGATFTMTPRDVIRASVGRYVQPATSSFQQYQGAPQWGGNNGNAQTIALLNNFYNGLGFNTVHGILPEDSTNYDLSIEHAFNGGMSAKLTPFYRDTRNQILTIPFNPATPSFTTGTNFGNAHIKGVEFLLQKNVEAANGIGGSVAVTGLDSRIRFTDSASGTSFIDFINGIGANGKCVGTPGGPPGALFGICGYNFAHHTSYALLDPNAYYPESFAMTPNAFSPSWDVNWTINAALDVRQSGFDIEPTLNYQSGNPYGDPLEFPDTTGVTGHGPDPYTNTFDSVGSLKGPSWWTLNLGVSHDVGHGLRASILGTNLWAHVYNHGYPWELPANLQNISYEDNGFYGSLPLGTIAAPASTALKYYGANYYPYDSAGILPLRSWVFSLSAKI